MRILEDLQKRAERLQSMLSGGSLMQSIITELQPIITDYNRSEQLYNCGVNALGVEIWSYRPYRPYTIREKQRKGQPYNRVTLKDTGDFYGSFKVDAQKEEFSVYATDSKTAILKDKYGAIFGLTEESKQKLIDDHLRSRLAEEVKKVIYG